jgi:hypothetical protein
LVNIPSDLSRELNIVHVHDLPALDNF